jgi:hypothetical protein
MRLSCAPLQVYLDAFVQADEVAGAFDDVGVGLADTPQRGAEIGIGSGLRRVAPELAGEPVATLGASGYGQIAEHSLGIGG